MLMELLKSGCSLQDAIAFLPGDVTWLNDKLQAGEEFSTILQEDNRPWIRHFTFFYRMSSLPVAMEEALRMTDFEEGLKKKFLRQSAYPMLILFLSFAMLQLFTSAIIPQMLESFAMEEAFSLTQILLHILQICSMGFFICVIMALLAFLYLASHAKIRGRFLYTAAKKSEVIRCYCSYLFAGYIKELDTCGIATMHALQFLQEVPISWMCEMAKRMQKRLEQGEAFLHVLETERLLSKQLYRCLQMRMLTQESDKPMQLYLIQQEQYWNHLLKKCSYLLQGIAYGFVAVLVILVF